VRRRIITLSQVSYLLKMDVYFYEAARRTLLAGCREIRAHGNTARLYVPKPLPPTLLEDVRGDYPSPSLLLRMTQYADSLKQAAAREPIKDVLERNFRGLENEIRIVEAYLQEREYEVGLDVSLPVTNLPNKVIDVDALRQMLSSPQVLSAVSGSVLLSFLSLASGMRPNQPRPLFSEMVDMAHQVNSVFAAVTQPAPQEPSAPRVQERTVPAEPVCVEGEVCDTTSSTSAPSGENVVEFPGAREAGGDR